MEFLPFSDTVLSYLAQDDCELKPYFRGVFPADKLPSVSKKRVNAYIVNTDPAGEPGEHWLGICTYHNTCEVFMGYRCLVTKTLPYKVGSNSGKKSSAFTSDG